MPDEKRGSAPATPAWSGRTSSCWTNRASVKGFSYPEGVAVDDERNVYGAEVSQHRITKWVWFR